MTTLNHIEMIYQEKTGSPLSLGIKMLSDSLIRKVDIEASSVTSQEAFKMGIINFFALIATAMGSDQMIGTIIIKGDGDEGRYRQQTFGSSKCGLEEYLDAYNIEILDNEMAGGFYTRYARSTDKHLIFIGGIDLRNKLLNSNPDFAPAILDSYMTATRVR